MVNYPDYLKLKELLSLQLPESAKDPKGVSHDEWLFITVHQTFELWFKQILIELDTILDVFSKTEVPEEAIGVSVARLRRILKIFQMGLQQVEILETMTALDFLDFRDRLAAASGFQSAQFREIEASIGLKDRQRIQLGESSYQNALKKDEVGKVTERLERKSLFEGIDGWLSRTPFLETSEYSFTKSYLKSVAESVRSAEQALKNWGGNAEGLEREKARLQQFEGHFDTFFDPEVYDALLKSGQKRLSFKAMQAAVFLHLYRDHPVLRMPYELISTLVDLDEAMMEWRAKHATMAHRMIGSRMGTGGSSGHEYLRRTAQDHRVFKDFFDLSSYLVPRSKIPPLPSSVVEKMNRYYGAVL
jgi:tryptophan 2,3-dioxygenase